MFVLSAVGTSSGFWAASFQRLRPSCQRSFDLVDIAHNIVRDLVDFMRRLCLKAEIFLETYNERLQARSGGRGLDNPQRFLSVSGRGQPGGDGAHLNDERGVALRIPLYKRLQKLNSLMRPQQVDKQLSQHSDDGYGFCICAKSFGR